MDPATMAALGSLGGMFGKGGGGTKVSQSVSNTSWSGISANISGISYTPSSGDLSATQTASAAATSSGTPSSGGGLLDSILSGGGSGADYSTPPSSLVQPAGGIFGTDTALYLFATFAALGTAAWFLFGRKKRG